MHILAALNFPPIGELVDWKLFGGIPGLSKTTLLIVIASLLTLGLFVVAGRKKALVPTGAQNLVEAIVEFVTDGIILETMGPDGMAFLPLLVTMFLFIFFCNLFEIIPLVQFPPSSRMAIPLMLALLVWVLYNYVGVRKQGLRGYLHSSLVPPGVPKALLPLVSFIEALQLVIVRPFSLAVRLFANMLAGHLLLVTFAILTDTLLFHNSVLFLKPIAILPAAMDVGLTGFELLVAVLQAFIFTILTAVYVAASMHPEH